MYKEFEAMMWNEGEKVIIDNGSTQTTIWTLPGQYMGQRIWKYVVNHLRYGEVDYGKIVEI